MAVFGVGLNKTGTTSLARACCTLGYRVYDHQGLKLGAKETTDKIEQAIRAGRHPLRHVARMRACNAFFDVRAVERNFESFDRHFPNSKFILHTRSLDDWLDSREKHVVANHERDIDTWTEVDRDAWIEQWNAQHDRVREYFAGRPDDLLVIDVSAGEGWDKLCPFLGKPVRTDPFPRLNTADNRL